MTAIENGEPGTAAHLAHWHRYGWERLEHHTRRFVEMVRGLDDDQLAVAVPDSDWCVVEVVAHVASVCRRYTVNRERAGDVAELTEHNRADVEAIGTDVDDLTADLLAQVAAMAVFPDLLEPSMELDFHAGQQLTLAGGWGNALSELLVHGDDIARATGVDWTLDGADLEPWWRFTLRALPGFLNDEGRRAADRWTLDLGFDSGPVRLRFDHGAVHVDESGSWQADHHITADPVLFSLTVPWRRRPADDPEVTLLLDRLLVI